MVVLIKSLVAGLVAIFLAITAGTAVYQLGGTGEFAAGMATIVTLIVGVAAGARAAVAIAEMEYEAWRQKQAQLDVEKGDMEDGEKQMQWF